MAEQKYSQKQGVSDELMTLPKTITIALLLRILGLFSLRRFVPGG